MVGAKRLRERVAEREAKRQRLREAEEAEEEPKYVFTTAFIFSEILVSISRE